MTPVETSKRNKQTGILPFVSTTFLPYVQRFQNSRRCAIIRASANSQTRETSHLVNAPAPACAPDSPTPRRSPAPVFDTNRPGATSGALQFRSGAAASTSREASWERRYRGSEFQPSARAETGRRTEPPRAGALTGRTPLGTFVPQKKKYKLSGSSPQ